MEGHEELEIKSRMKKHAVSDQSAIAINSHKLKYTNLGNGLKEKKLRSTNAVGVQKHLA